jgi:hypothetical protein
MVEIEVARLLEQTLQLDRMAAISIDRAHSSQRLLDGCAVLAGSLRVRRGLNHPVREERQDQRKVLLALRLTAQYSPSLLGFTAPLPMPMRDWRRDHCLDLFVGMRIRVGGKLIQAIPQSRDRPVDHRTGASEQPQRIRLELVGQAQRIAQGLPIPTGAH